MKPNCSWAIPLTLMVAGACEAGDDTRVKMGELPDLRLAARPAVSEAQARKIKDLIAGLAKLDKPDFGLSATLSGDSFGPLPDQAPTRALLFTNHDLQPSEGVKALVVLGPPALPFLLDALDDKTPTKLTMMHDGDFGGMWHATEVPTNPVNPAEAIAHKAQAAKQRDDDRDHVSKYTLKDGDVCFVAIGQIVGRSYQAVRYQPTARTVLN